LTAPKERTNEAERREQQRLEDDSSRNGEESYMMKEGKSLNLWLALRQTAARCLLACLLACLFEFALVVSSF
jgi:hypothetical protein